MGDINPSLPVVGQPDSTEEPKIVTALTQLIAAVNNVDTDQITDGAITEGLLATALQQKLGLNDATQVGRGKSIITATESRSNTAYGLLTTPDRVPGIVVPTVAKLRVTYQATWQSSVATAASAAIFIGANQLKTPSQPAPVVVDAFMGGPNTARDVPLSTVANGLSSGDTTNPAYTGDVTTGQVLAPVEITVAAGTYDISVQFKSTSGTVTVKNRLLIVETVGF
jgi:hypothetical protein